MLFWKKITLCVLSAHIFLLLACSISYFFAQRQKKPFRKINVQTILPTSPPKRIISKAPIKKMRPAPKKAKLKPKPKTSLPKNTKAQEKIVREIATNLQNIILPPNQKVSSHFTLPNKVEAPQKESRKNPLDYEKDLIAYLQSFLDLPEYGEVKIRLEIDSWGQIVSCQTLEAQSQKNAAFLKEKLKELRFPNLKDYGIVNQTQSFTITFKNAEAR